MTPPPRALPPGTRLGDWTVRDRIGQGGMGVVYRGEDAGGRRAAIKVLAPEIARVPRFRERFKREARIAASVVHPHVVACLGSGEAGEDVPWIAFELVAGGSLADLVKREGPLPWRRACARGAEVARGLAAIHAAGLVHRDLKPANLLLGPGGVAKVADLGLARDEAASEALTRTGEHLGTAEYMAPEQVDGARRADARADLYALGCTLHFLVAGEPPFPGTGIAVISRHLSEAPVPLGQLRPDVPRALEALVLDLLAKEPERRPSSALEVSRALEGLAALEEGEGRARRAGPLLGAGLALAALGLAGALVLVRRSPAEDSPPSPPASSRTTGPRPGTSPRPAPTGSATPSPRPTPAWFAQLPPESRPASLPAGVSVGDNAGEYVARDGSVLVYVPGGTFLMGVPDDEPLDPGFPPSNRPRHEVVLSPYFVGKYEVTNARWKRFAHEQDYVTQAERDGGGYLLLPEAKEGSSRLDFVRGTSWRAPHGTGPCVDECPVVQIAWADAMEYVRWAGLRLPTEAEWECAAGWDAGTRTARRYPWGDSPPVNGEGRRANVRDYMVPVPDQPLAKGGSFPEGRSPSGAFDMCGNVREWTLDRIDYEAYLRRKDARERDPCVASSNQVHVTRGGGFRDGAGTSAVTFRHAVSDGPDDSVGFRVALSADGSPRPRQESPK